MNTPVCFVRENTRLMLERIRKNSILNNWKLALCNTYRFSEYYTYGIFTDNVLGGKNHVITDRHLFPQIDISECGDICCFRQRVSDALLDGEAMGLWLQKKDRKTLSGKYLGFEYIERAVKEYWNV